MLMVAIEMLVNSELIIYYAISTNVETYRLVSLIRTSRLETSEISFSTRQNNVLAETTRYKAVSGAHGY